MTDLRQRWTVFGSLFGWTLYDFNHDLSAKFYGSDGALFEVTNKMREDIEKVVSGEREASDG